MPGHHQRELVRTLAWSVVVLFVFVVLLSMAIWWTSAHGRSAVVAAQRRACVRGVSDRISRRDQAFADWQANLAVSQDDTQSPVTRTARAHQATANFQSMLDAESKMPRRDRLTDEGARLPEFDCRVAFPDPGPFALQ